MHTHTQGASAPSVFHFSDTPLRVITINDQPWFVANDVCSALGLINSRKAVADLDDDEKGVTTSDTLGGTQKLNIINEAGLYCLIFKSRKPEAKKFKRWVTHEVLPAIRRTGQYTTPAAKAPPELMKRLRSKVSMAAHSFRFKHKAEHAIQARIRTETGAQSVSKLNTAQCLQAIDLVEMLTIGIHRHNNATARAEDQFLKNFVREDAPMPLQPYLLLTERDDSRSILPVEVSALDLAKMSTNAVGKSVVEHGLLTDDRDGFIRPWEETDGEG